MDDDVVDVVDEANNVIRQATRFEVHQKGLLHRTVIAEIRNSKGEWILVKQAADRQDPGQYVSPVGGHVEAGETVEAALKREALEETGLTDFKYKHVGNVIFNRPSRGHQENHLFIVYEIYSDNELVLNEEGEDTKSFTPKKLKQAVKTHPDQFGGAFYAVFKAFYPEILM